MKYKPNVKVVDIMREGKKQRVSIFAVYFSNYVLVKKHTCCVVPKVLSSDLNDYHFERRPRQLI